VLDPTNSTRTLNFNLKLNIRIAILTKLKIEQLNRSTAGIYTFKHVLVMFWNMSVGCRLFRLFLCCSIFVSLFYDVFNTGGHFSGLLFLWMDLV
jgi:hypothetical protein